MKTIGLIPSFDEKSYSLNTAYIEYVTNKLKSIPVIISSKEMIQYCDSILLMGGVDVDPTLFGFNNYSSIDTYRKMDLFHIACVEEAINKDKDVIGICRGFQLLSYIFLLPMYSDFNYLQDIDGHNQTELKLGRGNLVHNVLDARTGKRYFVNSMHHQCVIAPISFESEEITYYTRFGAPKNMVVVEGFSMKINNSNINAVQWHPEELK